MVRTYDLLEKVLADIEKGISDGINAQGVAKKHTLSEGHLRRLFKFNFKQPIAKYIRLRKLTASLDDLFYTDSKLVDIALEHGFSYEQSYIRAFKREFGITPGNLRKSARFVGEHSLFKHRSPQAVAGSFIPEEA
jgi:AraC family transcriptional regulator